ncbi:TetR/AcrR family transcriptional regulator [Streptomyces sp. NPDC093586]|uniref:TetR/AcrR family transcriptional regulator n=1 Tax=Streptomyces sp. NPDC093586 TaxID=3366042 RepID=UPI0037F89165
MPKSPTKRRPRTVAALNESGLALFKERGFHATSISDIVERAGLTRGAFYSNYKDKEELFLALYDAHADAVLATLRDAASDITPGRDPVGRLLDHLPGRSVQERDWFLVSMEFTLHAARHPQLAGALAVHEERLTQGLADVITAVLRSGGLRPAIDATDLARLVTALSEGLTALGLIHGTEDGAQRLGRTVTPLLTSALTRPLEERETRTAPAVPHPHDGEGRPRER